jgi:hypothetical protein
MAHIALPDNVPGIRGLMMFRPETAKPLNAAERGYASSTPTPAAVEHDR